MELILRIINNEPFLQILYRDVVRNLPESIREPNSIFNIHHPFKKNNAIVTGHFPTPNPCQRRPKLKDFIKMYYLQQNVDIAES